MNKELKDQWWALREDKSEKIRYDLIPLNMLTRLALHYTKWAVVHWDRNRESGNMEYAELCKQSAFRHFIQREQWLNDEDHWMACVWNIFAYEFLKDKNEQKWFQRIRDELLKINGRA